MKKLLQILCIALLAFAVGGAYHAGAQTRNVTFIVNTATVPDTLLPTADVRVTGSATAITGWGAGVPCTNIGGDYWSTTVALNTGDTVKYKIKVWGGGWEQDLIDPYGLNTNNRVYIVADNDTTLPLQFWNNGPKQDQYFRPWTAQPDSFINVYFRVDMQGIIQSGAFNWHEPQDGDSVGVRGDGKGGDMGWSPTFYLTRESPPTNSPTAFNVPANSFFSGRVRFRKSTVNPGDIINYKFIIGGDWGRDEYQGGHANRQFPIPVGLKDTTLQYVYYNDQKPNQRANPDTCYVTFRANLAAAIQSGGYSIGDTVVVRSGYFGTAVESGREKRLTRVGLSTNYQALDTVVSAIGNTLDYQYYVIKNGSDTRENYYNFTYSGPTPSEAERRVHTAPSKTYSILDTAVSIANARRQPVFPNSRTLARGVDVLWEVDIRPAIYQVMHGDSMRDVQGNFHVRPSEVDSIMKWGVWMNGPAVGGWSNTGTTDWDFGLMNNLDKKLYDDGTHGDLIAGDSIWSRTVHAAPESVGIGTKSVVGQVFKFGVKGGDNEGGNGGYGNNHLENIDDTGPNFTLLSQFGSINPAFYSQWDYDCHCPKSALAVGPDKNGKPVKFSLSQNYPNPFNPATNITYTIPSALEVTLHVFNVLGQEVATVYEGRQTEGQHVMSFYAPKLGSGVYYYKLTAGGFTATKKMLLIK